MDLAEEHRQQICPVPLRVHLRDPDRRSARCTSRTSASPASTSLDIATGSGVRRAYLRDAILANAVRNVPEPPYPAVAPD